MLVSSNKHIINTIFLEINTNSKTKGYYLKDNIDQFLQQEIIPILEKHFDTLSLENPYHSIQLEKLDIDISLHSNDNFDDFKQQILKNINIQIEKELNENCNIKQKESNNYKIITTKQKEINNFLHFLETGTTTWYKTANLDFKPNDNDTFEKIVNHKNFALQWVNTIQKPIARSRFIKQFNDDQIVIILKKIYFKNNTTTSQSKITSIDTIKNNIKKPVLNSLLTLQQRLSFWEIVILNLLNENTEIIKQKLSQLIYNILEFDKAEEIFLYQKQLLEIIHNQIKNQEIIKTLAHFNDTVLRVQKIITNTVIKEIKQKINTNSNTIIQKEQHNNSVADKHKNSLANSPKETKSSNDKINNNKQTIINNKNYALNSSNKQIIDQDIPGLYLDNIGLLLLHPFLKSFFNNCKLLNSKNEIINPELAAHLLHYAATGNEQAYEHLMVFEKFLCNIPITEPIERNIILPQEMKNEVSKMLQAVLSNWEVMKTSSVTLLQNEFLQRSGKLSCNDNESPKIVVERRTQDILLDKLSWNVSIIKLAWKNKIIYVDW